MTRNVDESGKHMVRDRSDGPTYFALIGDIVKSRDLPNRAVVQRKLQQMLEVLNEELADAGLATPLKLTAGDEIQGLLTEPKLAVDIVIRLGDDLHPASMVWGLGAGTLTTDLGRDVATLDGPCFHRARAAVKSAAADGIWLRAAGLPSPHGEAVGALFRLMGGLRSRWKEAQARYIRSVRAHQQREVAELHGVDESTVSKALHAARYRAVEEGEDAARALLEWVGRHQRSTPIGRGR